MKTKKGGFTLVELLVVIAIIALLMAVLLPALNRARENANRILCSNQLRQIGTAIPAYAADFEGLLPWWGYYGAEGDKEEMHPYVAYRGGKGDQDWMFPSGKLKAMRMACLYEGKYITEPKVFYCPSNRIPLYKYESYIQYQNRPTEWGDLPQDINEDKPNEWVRVGYIYYPTSRWGPKDSSGTPTETAKTIERLDQRIPYMTDVMRHKDELSHKTRSAYALHALFSDGHAVLCNDRNVFDDPAWAKWENGEIEWREFYYTIFKLIEPR